MNTTEYTTDEINRHNHEMRKHAHRNFWANSVEGGLYMAGVTFVARDTVLPPMIETLGGPAWMIALAPVLMTVGVSTPSIFIVHLIERLHWKKPILLISGALQRLPTLFAGLGLLLWAERYPLIVLYLVAFAPFVSGLFCGVTFPAWIELVAKTVPAARRASVFSTRMIIASLVGIGAGVGITKILQHWPGATGYGVLHLIAFTFLGASYIVFCMIKETDLPPKKTNGNHNFMTSLREIPQILREDGDFRNFLMSRCLGMAMFIVLPFVSIHALDTLKQSQDFLGNLVVAGVAGAISGNLLAAYAGDKHGGKRGVITARIGFILVFLCVNFFNSEILFYLAFFALGFCRDCATVSGSTLSIEICPVLKRPKYMAILLVFSLPFMLLVPLLGGWIWAMSKSYALISITGSAILLPSIILLAKVREPRRSSEKQSEKLNTHT